MASARRAMAHAIIRSRRAPKVIGDAAQIAVNIGLYDTARRMANSAVSRAPEDVELLKLGAGKSVNVELSDAYEPAAKQLASEFGFGDRMSQRFGPPVILFSRKSWARTSP